MTFTVGRKQGQDFIYDRVDDLLVSKRVTRDILEVLSAKLRIKFRGDGGKSVRSLTFHIGRPNTCSLKHEPLEEKARELLVRWGIDVSGDIAQAAATGGPAYQQLLDL